MQLSESDLDHRRFAREEAGRVGAHARLSFRRYLKLECHEMLKHKWIESEKAGHDLGAPALIDWVDNHSDAFRRDLRRRYGQQPGVPI